MFLTDVCALNIKTEMFLDLMRVSRDYIQIIYELYTVLSETSTLKHFCVQTISFQITCSLFQDILIYLN